MLDYWQSVTDRPARDSDLSGLDLSCIITRYTDRTNLENALDAPEKALHVWWHHFVADPPSAVVICGN
ncbi:hypothetical protein GMO_11440 [Gluconobacter morbifer G707]|uniref:Uncharacterized protein n=1 Tax=Gluconobacter morbifer G707 TaxID=1088869 RepID=G6XIR6_9PROT|nr:hypothetical protein GMO_11440 [Gluconobacter morbifer G707]